MKANIAKELNNILAGAGRDHLTQIEYRMQNAEIREHRSWQYWKDNYLLLIVINCYCSGYARYDFLRKFVI